MSPPAKVVNYLRHWGVVLLIGATSTLAQVVLARELMVSFRGNELSYGIILACWSLAAAVGSICGTRLATRRPTLRVEHTLLVLAPALLLALALARATPLIHGLATGAVPGIGTVLSASLLSLFPLCLVTGAQFPLACRDPRRPVSRAYIAEAAGGVVGGLAVALVLLPRLEAGLILWLLVCVNLAAAVALLVGPLRSLAAVLLVALLLAVPQVDRLSLALTRLRWVGEDVIAVHDSRHANLVVTTRGEQLSFFVSGSLAFSAPDPDTERIERAVYLPLLAHPAPRRTLLLGGVIAGNAAAAHAHPGLDVTAVELDADFVRLAAQHLSPAAPQAPGALIPPIALTDGRLLVLNANTAFDVVVVDYPGPATLHLNRYYTEEFFVAVDRVLAPGGIVAVVLPVSGVFIPEALSSLTWSVLLAMGNAFGSAPVVIPGDPLIALVGPRTATTMTAAAATLRPDVLAGRLYERGLRTSLLNTAYLAHILSAEQLAQTRRLLGEPPDIGPNRDLQPRAVHHYLALYMSVYGPASRQAYGLLAGFARAWPASPLLVLAALWLARRRRYPSVALTVGVTGFSGIILAVGLTLAYQSLLGYVYERLGLMSAGFMVGLVLGGLWASTPRRGSPGSASASLGAYCLALALILPRVSAWSTAPLVLETLLFTMLAAAGFLEGRIFALAARDADYRTGGSLWAADLVGMSVGALLVGTVLLPVVGHGLAFAALGATNLALAAGRRWLAAS